MVGISISMTCDWCDGELELFPQAKSGLRCRRCWRTEGNDNGPYSIKNKMNKSIGWLCPNCKHSKSETLSDGRKQCSKCENIFGIPLWKKYNTSEKTTREGNFTGK